ncbi:hypothetical protein Taro_029704 [Colocasia esculenta]|uniref:Uncharacterized protein n=1 Tax=Colocasia esculenta TaxID=4460 RepID=A0A843VU00_COLES|nr:hypothetical protein [Colocasia esculenta]
MHTQGGWWCGLLTSLSPPAACQQPPPPRHWLPDSPPLPPPEVASCLAMRLATESATVSDKQALGPPSPHAWLVADHRETVTVTDSQSLDAISDCREHLVVIVVIANEEQTNEERIPSLYKWRSSHGQPHFFLNPTGEMHWYGKDKDQENGNMDTVMVSLFSLSPLHSLSLQPRMKEKGVIKWKKEVRDPEVLDVSAHEVIPRLFKERSLG